MHRQSTIANPHGFERYGEYVWGLMIENYQSELLWNVFRRCPYIVKGLQRAGFRGGWLEAERAAEKR